jgi:hypothetical protein
MPPGSRRLDVAEVALEAALGVPDVLAGEAGADGLRVTAIAPDRVLRGVSAIAQADGRYCVDLRLVAGLVPLFELGDEVRRHVRRAATEAGLGDHVGDINVEFASVATGEDADAARMGEEAGL